MPQYRKKPVVINAWSGYDLINMDNANELPQPLADAVQAGTIVIYTENIDIKTLEGVMTAVPSDMIIMGVKGEFYPFKPDIFAATYEQV